MGIGMTSRKCRDIVRRWGSGRYLCLLGSDTSRLIMGDKGGEAGCTFQPRFWLCLLYLNGSPLLEKATEEEEESSIYCPYYLPYYVYLLRPTCWIIY